MAWLGLVPLMPLLIYILNMLLHYFIHTYVNVAGSDFILPTPMTFTLQPGQARSCLNVTIQDDTSVEDAEVFIVRFPSPSSLSTVIKASSYSTFQLSIKPLNSSAE